jgi:hypothetical protein
MERDRPACSLLARLLIMCLASLLCVGCVPSSAERKVLAVRRAATDLRCAEQRLTVEEVGDRLFRVSGCGRTTTYKIICKITVYTCELLDEAELAAAG